MVVLTNAASQTVEPGKSVVFTSLRQSGNSEFVNGSGSSQVFLKGNGLYNVDFSANVTNATAATLVQLQAELNGAPLEETLRGYTPAAIGAIGNMSFATAVSTVANCNFNLGALSITITNPSPDQTITITNPCLRIGRIG